MSTSNRLVICGPECSVRIKQSVLPHLDFELKTVDVEFKEEFLAALAQHQPPLSIVEWRIPVFSSRKDEAALIADGMRPDAAAMLAGSFTEILPAHAIFDQASTASPNTKFIIACHNKGQDIVKAHAGEYGKHPAVIKRMGFINGLVNMRYLAKLLTRTYAGRDWKPTF
jgi:hypothetical protein